VAIMIRSRWAHSTSANEGRVRAKRLDVIDTAIERSITVDALIFHRGEKMPDEDWEPVVRDLRPYPETPEARARGCQCRIVRNLDGTPVLGEDARIICSLTKEFPIPNHN
jgi:hypothetical protein